MGAEIEAGPPRRPCGQLLEDFDARADVDERPLGGMHPVGAGDLSAAGSRAVAVRGDEVGSGRKRR